MLLQTRKNVPCNPLSIANAIPARNIHATNFDCDRTIHDLDGTVFFILS